MSKDKKKGAKKGNQADDLLDEAAQSIKKFRKVTRNIGKLTTGQKVVGGIALLAAGLTYIAKKQADTEAGMKTLPGAEAAEAALAKLTSQEKSPEVASKKSVETKAEESKAPVKSPPKRPSRSKKSKQA